MNNLVIQPFHASQITELVMKNSGDIGSVIQADGTDTVFGYNTFINITNNVKITQIQLLDKMFTTLTHRRTHYILFITNNKL